MSKKGSIPERNRENEEKGGGKTFSRIKEKCSHLLLGGDPFQLENLGPRVQSRKGITTGKVVLLVRCSIAREEEISSMGGDVFCGTSESILPSQERRKP